MADIAAIGAALTGAKAAYDLAKGLRESNKSYADAEAQLKLADLIGQLAEIKVQLAEVQLAASEKDQEIVDLKKALSQESTLIYEDKFYFFANDEDRKNPLCSPCYDSKKKVIRLEEREQGYFFCHVCKTPFFTDDYDSKPMSVGIARA